MMETTVVVNESGLRSLASRSLGAENASAAMDPFTDPVLIDLFQSVREAEERRDAQIARIASLAGQEGAQAHAQQVLGVMEKTLRQARMNLSIMELLSETE